MKRTYSGCGRFDPDSVALPVVARELGVAFRCPSSSLPGLDQARGQVDRVVDAAVHAHAAEGVVDMRGISDQERTSELECRRHPLMHLVKSDMGDLVARDARHQRGHERLGEFRACRQLVAFISRHREHHAAEPRNLQQEVPALRVGHVAHCDQIGNHGGKIERGAHHQGRG